MQNAVNRRGRWVLEVLFACVLMLQMASAAAPPKPNQGLYPSASGKTYEKSGVVIDYGNAYDGYVMVKYTKSGSKRVKCIVTKSDNQYNYDIPRDGKYVVLPLQMGSGKYKIALFEQISGTKYSALTSKSVEVELSSKYIPYLYPNQYVDYNQDTRAVAKSNELCAGLATEREKFDAIWKFCTQEISYHYIRASTVQSGYLPDIDQVLRENLGICFDYSALMACMLRTQQIPTQMVIGYADKTYHAWNKVLLDGEWIRKDATFNSTGAGDAKNYTEERRY